MHSCLCEHACDCVIRRYKSLVGIRELPDANGENCVIMLSKLCPLTRGAYHVGVTKVRFNLCCMCILFYVLLYMNVTRVCVNASCF